MKSKILILISIFITIIGEGQTFIKQWETDTLFQKPESALYDSVNDIIYVSNINGEYLAHDGNGFISTLKTNGKLINLKWADGLNNPQGLGLYKNKLYVADINRVVEINTQTAKIENEFVVDSAKFFNDIAADKNGDIYVSDCFGNKIYKIANGKISIWLDESFIEKPNGLLCTNNAVLILNMKDKTIYSINKISKEHKIISRGIDNLDGIVSNGKMGYFVSGAWQGQLYFIDEIGNKTLMMDLSPNKTVIADIEYIVNQKLLIIPTLNHTVMGYQWME